MMYHHPGKQAHIFTALQSSLYAVGWGFQTPFVIEASGGISTHLDQIDVCLFQQTIYEAWMWRITEKFEARFGSLQGHRLDYNLTQDLRIRWFGRERGMLDAVLSG